MPQGHIHFAHFPSQAQLVHATQLIQKNPGLFAVKGYLRAATQGLTFAGQRRNDHPGQHLVHVVG